MFSLIKQFFAPPTFTGDIEKTRIAGILNAVLWATFGLSLVTGPILILFPEGQTINMVIVAVLDVVFLGLIILLRRGFVQLSGILLTSLFLLLFVASNLLFGGIRSTITTGYLIVIFLAGLILGTRGSIIFGGLSLVAVFIVTFSERQFDAIPLIPGGVVGAADIAILFGLIGVMAVLVSLALRNITSALFLTRSNASELSNSLEELEISRNLLQNRSDELERRSLHLQTAAEFARDVTAIHDLDILLMRATALIRDQFGFYHVDIFLIDNLGEYAMLRMASGYEAKAVMAEEIRIRIGQEGTIGRVSKSGETYISQDVNQDPYYQPLPFLEQIQSEALFPLKTGDEILGVLAVMSDQINAFNDDDIAVLEMISDQIAAAIESARLFRDMQQTLHELEISSGRYTRQTWREIKQQDGYRYHRLGIEPIFDRPSEVNQAWQVGAPIINQNHEDEDRGMDNTAALPIILRGETIGVLHLRSQDSVISADTLSLVEQVSERLALALENARLLEDTQQRASRESFIGEVTGRMRETLDIETILETAVNEIGAAMGLAALEVQIGNLSADNQE